MLVREWLHQVVKIDWLPFKKHIITQDEGTKVGYLKIFYSWTELRILNKWALSIQAWIVNFRHCPFEDNKKADYLSRNPDEI